MRHRNAGFTLLELLVVLAILAIVTGLAVRSLDGVQDQHRYDTNRTGVDQLRAAIVGSDDDRASDGARTVSGFVADLGRLPRTVAQMIDDESMLTLAELFERREIPEFAVRQATGTEIADPSDEDPEVFIAGGWRGPYVRLPLGAKTLLDGWGNPYVSPVSGNVPVPRLLNAHSNPLTSEGQAIERIQHLGANGSAGGDSYDQDEVFDLSGSATAKLTGRISVISDDPNDPEDTLVPADSSQSVTIRVFGPNPANAAQTAVIARTIIRFDTNPLPWEIPASPAGSTVGPRMVRAYLHVTGVNVASSALRRSAVKAITVRSGVNVVDFKVDR